MLHEKPHEPFRWKDKLDELDHVPSEPPTNKTVAWEKLQGRLQKKPRSKKTVWYWMAAACLLLVAGMPWLMLDQKEPIGSQRNSPQTAANPKSVNAAVKNVNTTVKDEKEEPSSSSSMLVNGRSATIVKAESKTPHHPLANMALITEETTIVPDTINEILPKVTNRPSNNLDPSAEIAVVPAKKKLRIVHINELNNREEQTQIVKNASSPDFLTQPFRQDEGNSSISLSRNASDNILKIKLTPSN